jgi:serine phosphatase RsbU (regulator of sigma subunit)
VSESTTGTLERRLMQALVEGEGLNDCLRRFMDAIGATLGVTAAVLYDYDERHDTFDLLFFTGYPPNARSELHQRLTALQIERAVHRHEPWPADNTVRTLVVPLRFRDTLEAVLVLERSAPFVPGDELDACCRLISRFVGLFMSSNRLAINQTEPHPEQFDLARARDVQQSYLPSTYPATDRYEIFGYNQSSAVVGGDYLDYFENDASVQCVLADACGHGLAAALVMSHFRGLLRAEVRRPVESGTLFTRLNQLLYGAGASLSYLTGVFLDYRQDAGQLAYLNAGHFDPVVVHPSGSLKTLRGGGPPLGMFPWSDYAAGTTSVQPGDLLVLFTDGLVELENEAAQCFGSEGVSRAVVAHRHRPLSEVATEILLAAGEWSGGASAKDDLTLFLMRFR